MALSNGLQTSLSSTGHPLNLFIMREGSQAEGFSSLSRDDVRVVKYVEDIAKNERGEPFVSPESIVLTRRRNLNSIRPKATLRDHQPAHVQGVGRSILTLFWLTPSRFFS